MGEFILEEERYAGALSDRLILEEIEKGRIIIEPFIRENLGTCSYDVTLGENFFREKHGNGVEIFNFYDKEHVERVWGTIPEKAVPLGKFLEDPNFFKQYIWKLANDNDFTIDDLHLPEPYSQLFKNISQTDKIILLMPGETILAHTNEFVGGKEAITTMMKARSSKGRSFIEVCKCAGWGDVGYVNRWTMEITNNSKKKILPLVVGRRISQIIFFYTGKTLQGSYTTGKDSKYCSTEDIESLKKNWHPLAMLPKLYKDKEIKKSTSL
ncbi:MAG: hypothetical protein QW331_03610 [Candidatus Woesearchaeota archaeon]